MFDKDQNAMNRTLFGLN